MTIKEVSEKYNLSNDTLRYYEKVGLIGPISKNSSGIRNYYDILILESEVQNDWLPRFRINS